MTAPNVPIVLTQAHIDEGLKVWIDQDLCTGDGLCEEINGDVFKHGPGGVYWVINEEGDIMEPGGSDSLRNIPKGQEALTAEAQEECPGSCIFIETTDGSPLEPDQITDFFR